jgi:hypothetical protein
MLLSIWATDPYRPTRDADLLSYGNSEPTNLAEISQKSKNIFINICHR